MRRALVSFVLVSLSFLCLASPARAARGLAQAPSTPPLPLGETLRAECQAYAEAGDLSKAIEACERALEAFQDEGSRTGQGEVLLGLGWLHEQRQEYDAAQSLYSRALSLHRELADLSRQAQAAGGLCRVRYWLGDDVGSSSACAQAATLFHQAGANADEATAHYILGLALQRQAAASGDQASWQGALDAYSSALTLYQDVGDPVGESGALMGIGDLYTLVGDAEAALAHYLRALPIRREVGSTPLTMVTLGTIASTYEALSDSQNALKYYQEALPLRQEAGDRPGEAVTLSGMGLAEKRLGHYPESLAYYEQALFLWRALGNRPWEALLTASMGDIHAVRFDYSRAVSAYEEALSIYRELQDRPNEALTLHALAGVYFDLADYAQALRTYERALAIRQEVGDRLGASRTLNNMALVYDTLSQYQRALGLYREALAAKQQVGDRAGQAAVLGNIAAVYAALYDNRRALDTYGQALEIARASGDEAGVMAALSGMGTVLRQEGRNEEALDYHRQALEAARAGGDRKGEAAALGNLAVVYDVLGRDDEALDLHRQALAIRQEIGDVVGRATTQTLLGELLLESSDLAAAESYLTTALQTWQATGDLRSEATTLGDLALLYDLRGQPTEAADTALRAIDTLESIYSAIKIEDLQSAFSSGVTGYYHYTVRLLLDQGRPEEAFELAERGRARAFLNTLGNQAVDAKATEDPALARSEAALRARMAAVERTLRGTPKPDDERALLMAGDAAAELSTLRGEYAQLLRDLQLSNPEYASLVSVNPLTLSETQALLRDQAPDLTLLSYFVGAEQLVIFVITADQLHVAQVPLPEEALRRQVQALLQEMRVSPLLPDAWQTAARSLYTWLVAPVEPYLPPGGGNRTPRLGIIPFGQLHYLPFGLLYGEEIAGGGDPPLLQDRYTIFYAPSASSLRFILQSRPAAESGILVMANADAPGAPHLAHAAGEARTVAALYGTTPLLGDQATESRFMEASGAAEIIHLAAHSDLQPANPLFSAILLRPDSAGDGRLETHEIMNLGLPATDLVVLSACQTHLGDLSEGDDLVGLERAFFRAGTSSLLTTLWPVDDQATALLVQGFYTRLRAGTPRAESLRQAQQETRAAFPHPYYWAGFVLVGDPGEPEANAPAVPWGWLLGGAGSVGLAALLAAFLLRRRRTPGSSPGA